RAEFNNGAYTDDDIADVFTQRITTPLHIYKNVFIPNGLYHFTRHQLTYGSGKERRFTYNFFERFGGYYGGTLNEFRVRANYRPMAKFSISASETWDRFRLPLTNGKFSVVLASVQGNYSFTRFLTFTSLIQLDTSNTQAMSANVRLRNNYRDCGGYLCCRHRQSRPSPSRATTKQSRGQFCLDRGWRARGEWCAHGDP